jgi:hypothetical protein
MKALHELSETYKCTGVLDSVDKFRFQRSNTSRSGMECQLWDYERKHVVCYIYKNPVIVFIYKDKCYAIPLLKNKYKKFWDFKLDNNSFHNSDLHTTFLKELDKMYQALCIKDSANLKREALLNFMDVLGAKYYEPCDSSLVFCFLNIDDDKELHLGEDRTREYLKRLIPQTIHKEMNIENGIAHNHDFFWDRSDLRMIQIKYDYYDIIDKNKFNPTINIYRIEDDELFVSY